MAEWDHRLGCGGIHLTIQCYWNNFLYKDFEDKIMNRETILKILSNQYVDLATKYGVRNLGLFGSYARDQQNPLSDIDILVSFAKDIDLFDFIDLKEYLERLLGEKVDLVMASALKPSISKRILGGVQYV
jgi:uncharacterized protein